LRDHETEYTAGSAANQAHAPQAARVAEPDCAKTTLHPSTQSVITTKLVSFMEFLLEAKSRTILLSIQVRVNKTINPSSLA
jgi:hypothetical protein